MILIDFCTGLKHFLLFSSFTSANVKTLIRYLVYPKNILTGSSPQVKLRTNEYYCLGSVAENATNNIDKKVLPQAKAKA